MTLKSTILATEAIANVIAYRWMTLLIAGICAGISFVAVAFSVSELVRVENRYLHMLDEGLDVWRVQSSSGMIAAACESLSSMPGISASGSLISIGPGSANLPGDNEFTLVVGTVGYMQIAWNLPPDNQFGVVAGSQLHERFGLRPGQSLVVSPAQRMQGTSLLVDAIMQPGKRIPGLNQWMFIAVPAEGQKVGECLVQAAPGARSAVEKLLLHYLAPDATVSPIVVGADQAEKGIELEFKYRASRFAPLLAGFAALLCCLLLVFIRRAEWALYRILGAKPSGILLMVVVEYFVVGWCPMVLGSMLAIILMPTLPSMAFAALALQRDLIELALLMIVIPAAAWIFLSAGDFVNRVKGQ